MGKIRDIQHKNIVLDTNIPVYYSTEGFKERSNNVLRPLIENSNKIAISEITAFELLRAEQKDHVARYHYSFVNYTSHITRLPVDQASLQNATILAAEYRRICNGKKINIPDLIIGGTIMSYAKDTLLMTTDRKDFCEPLWKTVAHECVLKDDEQRVDVNLYLLSFQFDIVLEKYKDDPS